jgi:L-alanine-DL-glutamate epimerase-like enolase superfamily enzyme
MSAPVDIDAGRPLIIERAEVHLYRIPPAGKWEDATHRVSAIEIITLDLMAADLVARGFSYTAGVGGTAVRALLQDYCLAELVGRDALMVVETWQSLYRHLHRTGMGATTTLALAAIDTALWELRSLATGRPLYVELGGVRKEIPTYASSIDLHLSPAEIGNLLTARRHDGYSWFKIKVGLPALAADVARVEAAREAIGWDNKLLLDANQAWDLDESARRCRALERFDPTWLEEPMAPEDVLGHAELRRKTAIPVAIGESLYTIGEFRAYLEASAADVLQPDIGRVGGFTPWLRIAALCGAWHKPIAPHYLVEQSLHALCAVENGLVLEDVSGGSLFDLGLVSKPVARNGGIALPGTTAGHGLEFVAPEIIAAFEVPSHGYIFEHQRSSKV